MQHSVNTGRASILLYLDVVGPLCIEQNLPSCTNPMQNDMYKTLIGFIKAGITHCRQVSLYLDIV